ncbi:YHYH protein [Alphaproteobacteria bacterium KMM 3653]|uniref:YHYH protein n=1 Tax=Harenicola maris TaxID=2841044 RepID=A0AAP2CQT6_9RHOB|nr:YHYH protein [Harenicola maris]
MSLDKGLNTGPNTGLKRKSTIALRVVGLGVLVVGLAAAQMYRKRVNTATEVASIDYVLAEEQPPAGNRVRITRSEEEVAIKSNSMPPHLVGLSDAERTPRGIQVRRVAVSVPARPEMEEAPTPMQVGWRFGVSVHGIMFDPLTPQYWKDQPDNGWNYNALSGAVELGIDTNLAHTSREGVYHYHGIPYGLMTLLGYSEKAHSPLIGYAADGFPIYAVTGRVDGEVVQMTPSYRLKSGTRPGGRDAPGGGYDGTFHADYEYVEGLGNLDVCNGAFTVSVEYPQGTYAYFLTSDYPVIPTCWRGTPDASFMRHEQETAASHG